MRRSNSNPIIYVLRDHKSWDYFHGIHVSDMQFKWITDNDYGILG